MAIIRGRHMQKREQYYHNIINCAMPCSVEARVTVDIQAAPIFVFALIRLFPITDHARGYIVTPNLHMRQQKGEYNRTSVHGPNHGIPADPSSISLLSCRYKREIKAIRMLKSIKLYFILAGYFIEGGLQLKIHQIFIVELAKPDK